MRRRVPRQASTKWWILLAAAIASALTWCDAASAPPRPRRAAEATERDGARTYEIEIVP